MKIYYLKDVYGTAMSDREFVELEISDWEAEEMVYADYQLRLNAATEADKPFIQKELRRKLWTRRIVSSVTNASKLCDMK